MPRIAGRDQGGVEPGNRQGASGCMQLARGAARAPPPPRASAAAPRRGRLAPPALAPTSPPRHPRPPRCCCWRPRPRARLAAASRGRDAASPSPLRRVPRASPSGSAAPCQGAAAPAGSW
ncbi:MAG: hypothetical protein J3K34DRAFT_378919 [Monoraphidium minutum]|nr:MAG: hypothetical protein J3K34DRAFT_378919 [Monoraphidium minutum]